MEKQNALISLTLPITIMAVIFGLSWATTIFAPLALALFLLALVWPIQHVLEAFLPKILALLLVAVAIAGVIVAFTWLIAWGFGRVAAGVSQDAAQFQALFASASNWLDSRGIVVPSAWSEFVSTSWILRTLQSVTSRVNSALTFAAVALIYVTLGLLEVRDFAGKFNQLQRRDIAEMLLRGGEETAKKIRIYMIVRTQMSILTGVMAALIIWSFSLNHAAEWGVITFVLNFIPVIGPFIASIFPTVFALVQFQSVEFALAVFLVLTISQFLIGNYIEPLISGAAVSMSPVVILFAVFFWTFLWGIFGTFIGVPITIAVLTFCAHHPSSRWISDLFGGGKKAGVEATTAQAG